MGLQVESYWGEQEITIRTVEGNLKLPQGFSGCTILADGRVVPLLEPIALLRTIEQSRAKTAPGQVTVGSLAEAFDTFVPKIEEKPLVMVVDDSINVRRFLAITLEKAGYRVQQAKDGQEALDKLKEGLPVKAVICDLEMPRLDGYGFLANLKSNSMLKYIPVMILTSRSGEKHRQMAMRLGATAYFSKPFQEQGLLQTLQDLIENQFSLPRI